ncbi:MAG: hypothetical protein M1818_002615 [Claussenomyces sp. TS43310]|nr:MAG: hypothetical protein M1818_002615 [Claussenomyces sp. TS43310]
MVSNKGVIFRSIPTGFPVPGKDLVIETQQFDLDQAPPAGGVIIKTLYASFDPYMRGRMRDASIESYSPAFTLNEPITSWSLAKILKSDHPGLKEGDLIVSMIPVAEYSVLSKDFIGQLGSTASCAGTRKIDNKYGLDPKLYIAALGMPGLTAYSSFYAIGKPVKGETIFVSAASGAVGQLVGQLAKHEGLRVIGSVGSQEKLDYITKELKFDGGFNYKTEKPADALKRLAPDGIDIFYDNVGGEQLQAALDALKPHGRTVVCGMISEYNSEEKFKLGNLMQIVAKRLTIRGFIVGDKDMGHVYGEEHIENVSKWLKEGSFVAKLSVTDGIDNAVEGFVGLLQGKNFGKAILKIADA